MAEQPIEHLGIDTWVDALGGLAADLNRGIARADLLNRIAAVCRQLTGFDFCAVLLTDSQRQELRIEGFSGLTAEYVALVNTRHPLKLKTRGQEVESPSARAFISGVAVWIPDIDADKSFREWSIAAHMQDYRAMLSVPLAVGDTTRGTLNCYARAVTPRSNRAIRVVRALADYAGTAIETDRLRAAERTRLQEVSEVNRQLTARRETDERSELLHLRLIAVALDDGGVPALAEALGQCLACRVRIEDHDGDPLGCAPADAPSVALPSSARADDLDGHSPVQRVGDLFTAAVDLDEQTVARIWAEPSPIGEDVQRRAMAHAATVCALILLRSRAAHEADARARTDLVNDLLSDDRERVQAAFERARRSGHRMTVPRRVLLVRPQPPDRVRLPPKKGGVDALAAALVSRVPNLIAGRYRGDLVALWPVDESNATVDPVATLERVGATATAHIVVGPVCDAADPFRFRAAYRIARGAAGLAGRLPHKPVLRLDRLGIYHLLLQLDDPAAITRFAADTLRPLRDNDAAHGTDLVATIRAYLDNGCATKATAAALFVHPNTVNLRLRRVEALLEVDLRRTHDVLNLSAALAADDVAGALGQG